ncbi:hypothetical protein [Nesterenkonia pannonica]|uniref:hypothetical protein n=1 Tax=Nesterenkonia pannonica TaxID=1548602 RepID=UPI0021641EEC|nr:hypothetical protein [Nesterenkonia pannonica]
MVVSFCVAAGAGILVLLGVSFGRPGKGAAEHRDRGTLQPGDALLRGHLRSCLSRSLGVAGVVVSMLTLGWSLVLIWREWSWDFEPFQVLFSGITLTIALSFANLVVASTAHRDQLIRLLLAACLGLTAVAVLLTLLLIWDSGWEGNHFRACTAWC